MEIAKEWLTFERDVLGKRPLITGTVEEVREAYRTTSDMLAAQYPAAEDYGVIDRTCSLLSLKGVLFNIPPHGMFQVSRESSRLTIEGSCDRPRDHGRGDQVARVHSDRIARGGCFSSGCVVGGLYFLQSVAKNVPAEMYPSAHGGGHVNGGAWKSSFEDRMI